MPTDTILWCIKETSNDRKMYWLIAGYNTMTKEEKEKYNIEGIANVFWTAMSGMALVIISGKRLYMTGGAYNSQEDKLPFAILNDIFLPTFSTEK